MKLLWKIVIGVVVVAVVGSVIFFRQRASQNNQPKTYSVERRDVAQDVAFTGKLRAKQRAQLGFESTGTVVSLPVKVGDVVVAGQVLAKLDPRSASLEAARAAADSAAGADRARLAWQDATVATQQTKTSNTAAVEASRQSVRNAKTEMDQAQEVWQQTVRESGDESSISKAKYSAVLSVQSAYRTAQKTLASAEASAGKTNQTAAAVADEAYAAYVATQQAARGVSGLSSLQATQQLANLRVSKSIAFAPFAGVVTAKGIEQGELAVAGTPVVTIETPDQLEIIADVPESDITKLQTDMMASFTLDAFTNGRERNAKVVSIAPAAKVVEGVPTYEVILELPISNVDLKSGMTANVTVQTAKREGVVAVPRRAVAKVGGIYKVKIMQPDTSVVEQEVELGVLGSDGYVEVTKGLSGGETVVLPTTATQ